MDEATILAKAVSGYWACSNCSNVEFYEREIKCWKCGEGEMLYQDKEALRSFIERATTAFKKVQEAEDRETDAYDAGWNEAKEAAIELTKDYDFTGIPLAISRLRKGKP